MHGTNVLLGVLPNGMHVSSPILDFMCDGHPNNVKCLECSKKPYFEGRITERNIHYSLSTESMKEKSSSTSAAHDQKVELGVAVPIKGL